MNRGIGASTTPTIQLICRDHPEYQEALRLAVTGPAYAPAATECTFRTFLEAVERQKLNTDLVLALRNGGRIAAACAAVESPGRTAMVFLGAGEAQTLRPEMAVALLQETQTHAWRRQIVVLQALLDLRCVDLAITYRDAGFRYLAELVYLDCPLHQVLEQPHKVNRLKCVTYADERLPDFLRTLEATYEGSLDCPHLSGLRDTLDVFRGHQHTGIGHPSLWFLAYMDNQPVGILLMAGVVDRPCLEIVYMGVDARSRGRRIGGALLSQAFSVARERRSEALTLAVDGNNVYAWRLYRRWGFRETTRRRAWIAHQAK